MKINLGNCNDTYTTKDYAKQLGISTNKAYKLLCKIELEGYVVKFGYYNRGGTDDILYSNRHCQSLIWQTCKGGIYEN